MKRVTAVLTILLLAGVAGGTQAQEVPAKAMSVYDIELVVFRHLRPLISSEQWGSQTIAANLDGALDLSRPETLFDLEEIVTPSEPQRLLEHVAKLGTLSNFEVLVHRAWRQPGFENDAALAVRLNAGPLDEPLVEQRPATWGLPFSATHGEYAEELPVDDAVQVTPQTSTLPQPNAQQQSSVQQPAEAQPLSAFETVTEDDLATATTLITHTLDGTVTLVRSRFLHVYTDLIYTIPSDTLPHAIRQRPLGNPVQATIEVGSGSFGLAPEPLSMQSFPLRYHRRMRSNELHYIDHPLLGILILATPVEADASELTQ
jgi:hypothetical protein